MRFKSFYLIEDENFIADKSIGKIIHEIDFPSLRQTHTYSCGASVVQAIMIYYGTDVREDEVIKDLGTDEDGTDWKEMVRYLEDNGFKIKYKESGGTFEELKTWIDKDIPVIVFMQAYPEEDGVDWTSDYNDSHYNIIIGYSDNGFIFSDSAAPEKTFLTYEDFDKRWHDINDDDSKAEHSYMVALGKTPKYSSEKIIKQK